MGQTCGCHEKSEEEQEIKTEYSKKRQSNMNKAENANKLKGNQKNRDENFISNKNGDMFQTNELERRIK